MIERADKRFKEEPQSTHKFTENVVFYLKDHIFRSCRIHNILFLIIYLNSITTMLLFVQTLRLCRKYQSDPELCG